MTKNFTKVAKVIILVPNTTYMMKGIILEECQRIPFLKFWFFSNFWNLLAKCCFWWFYQKFQKKEATATIITQKIPNWVIITFKIGLVVTTATFEHFLSVFDHWLARGKQTNLWQNVVSEMKKMGTKSIGTYMASPEYHNFFVKMC